MNISPVSYKAPDFRANRRSIFDNNCKLLYKTTTYFFRDDFDWQNFLELIKYKYRNTEKVNFIIEGCSNGAECYSCAMKLLTGFGEREAKKFFPIIAKDIDYENIQNAKNGRQMGISDYDLFRINYHTKNRLYEFMNFNIPISEANTMSLSPKQKLRDCIDFSQANIMQDLENIPSRNTILFCRNFWQYLDTNQRSKLAYTLGQKFDSSSIVCIGDFDSGAEEVLIQNGFEPIHIKNLYIKPSYQNYYRL